MRKISTILMLTFLLAMSAALAHEGHSHVMGTVEVVTAAHIEVKTKDGKAVTVPITKETRYVKGKEKAAQTDVHVGDRVVVDLEKSGTAEEVRLSSGMATTAHEHTGH